MINNLISPKKEWLNINMKLHLPVWTQDDLKAEQQEFDQVFYKVEQIVHEQTEQ